MYDGPPLPTALELPLALEVGFLFAVGAGLPEEDGAKRTWWDERLLSDYAKRKMGKKTGVTLGTVSGVITGKKNSPDVIDALEYFIITYEKTEIAIPLIRRLNIAALQFQKMEVEQFNQVCNRYGLNTETSRRKLFKAWGRALKTDSFLADVGHQFKELIPEYDALLANEQERNQKENSKLPRPNDTQLHLDMRQRDKDSGNRYYFSLANTELLDRESELMLLSDFSGSGFTFSWTLISGRGGVGKSRLAFEFARQLATEGWRVGFLGRKSIYNNFDWLNWEPARDILIVIDYAAQLHDLETNNSFLEDILSTFSDRRAGIGQPFNCKVRIILIERESETWLEPLTLNDNIAASRFVYDLSISDNREIVLQGLKDPWPLMESILDGQLDNLPEKTLLLNKLNSIDQYSTPLFAFMFAEHVANEPQGWQALGKRELLSKLLVRERKEFWHNVQKNGPEERMVAVATMAGNFSPVQLSAEVISKAGFVRWDFDHSPSLFRSMSGQSSLTDVFPLEPDILGEFFVLELLEFRAKDLGRALVQLAWKLDSLNLGAFIGRCSSDFEDTQNFYENAFDLLLEKPDSERAITDWLHSICLSSLRSNASSGQRESFQELVLENLSSASIITIERILFGPGRLQYTQQFRNSLLNKFAENPALIVTQFEKSQASSTIAILSLLVKNNKCYDDIASSIQQNLQSISIGVAQCNLSDFTRLIKNVLSDGSDQYGNALSQTREILIDHLVKNLELFQKNVESAYPAHIATFLNMCLEYEYLKPAKITLDHISLRGISSYALKRSDPGEIAGFMRSLEAFRSIYPHPVQIIRADYLKLIADSFEDISPNFLNTSLSNFSTLIIEACNYKEIYPEIRQNIIMFLSDNDTQKKIIEKGFKRLPHHFGDFLMSINEIGDENTTNTFYQTMSELMPSLVPSEFFENPHYLLWHFVKNIPHSQTKARHQFAKIPSANLFSLENRKDNKLWERFTYFGLFLLFEKNLPCAKAMAQGLLERRRRQDLGTESSAFGEYSRLITICGLTGINYNSFVKYRNAVLRPEKNRNFLTQVNEEVLINGLFYAGMNLRDIWLQNLRPISIIKVVERIIQNSLDDPGSENLQLLRLCGAAYLVQIPVSKKLGIKFENDCYSGNLDCWRVKEPSDEIRIFQYWLGLMSLSESCKVRIEVCAEAINAWRTVYDSNVERFAVPGGAAILQEIENWISESNVTERNLLTIPNGNLRQVRDIAIANEFSS